MFSNFKNSDNQSENKSQIKKHFCIIVKFIIIRSKIAST
jgi:hypothetical protein